MAVPEWIIHGLVLGTLATLAGLIVRDYHLTGSRPPTLSAAAFAGTRARRTVDRYSGAAGRELQPS